MQIEGRDDGGVVPDDGCSATCTIEPGWVCGDGLVRGSEVCDPSLAPNTVDGDGCSATCTIEAGWSCGAMQCVTIPGDGLVVGAEECDDGNIQGSDGCTSDGVVEVGWSCVTPGSPCTALCGDGLTMGDEVCETSYVLNWVTYPVPCCNAGCSGIVPGWSATLHSDGGGNAMSHTLYTTCSPICGDGVLLGDESCEDGNAASGDGCSDICTQEAGWSCVHPRRCLRECAALVDPAVNPDHGWALVADIRTHETSTDTFWDTQCDIIDGGVASRALARRDSVVRVTVGEYVDYFRPSTTFIASAGAQGAVSLCAMLKNGASYDWAPTETGPWYVGTVNTPTTYNQFQFYYQALGFYGGAYARVGVAAPTNVLPQDSPFYSCATTLDCVSPTATDVPSSHPCSATGGNTQCCRPSGTGISDPMQYVCTSTGLTCDINVWGVPGIVRVGDHNCMWGKDGTSAVNRLATAVTLLDGVPPTAAFTTASGAMRNLLPIWGVGAATGQPAGGCCSNDTSSDDTSAAHWGLHARVHVAAAMCNDGNAVAGDGCSTACSTESGWECFASGTCVSDTDACGDGWPGGTEECDDANTVAGDGCSTSCTVEPGWSCPTHGVACTDISVCGDGTVSGAEGCDNGNVAAGDGCSASCTVEPGWGCTGGSPSTPSVCAPVCGDGWLAGTEGCDDGNVVAGDGCSASCTLEPGWGCTACTYPTTPCTPTCDTVCGNGVMDTGEDCDDGNTAAGDGCSAVCTTEPGWSCSWTAPSVCTAVGCGDGYVAGAEGCDDGNVATGDGCSATCTLEEDWTCPTPGQPCEPKCGNSRVDDADEGCDDGGLVSGDGCSASCTVEAGWGCTGGSSSTPSVCAPVCGDGVVIAPEVCDDGNAVTGDGCDATCVSECGNGVLNAPGESCDDGNTVAGDGCSHECTVESVFMICTGQPSVCVGCGDGVINTATVSYTVDGQATDLAEVCDDGNTASDDGCNVACSVESGWVCEGTPSVCRGCGDGVLQSGEQCDDGNEQPADGCNPTCLVEAGWSCAYDPASVPQSSCTPVCGDGVVAGPEGCDDCPTTGCTPTGGDGCSATCTLEAGWSCVGSTTSNCSTVCGDGLLVGAEGCDDGNYFDGDGCDGCVVQPGWVCATPGEPCTAVCGDGLVVGTESCDDGNVVSGDGCNWLCVLEAGYSCPTLGAPCVTVCGDGIRKGTEVCDDGNSDGGDGCSVSCTLEPGWACPSQGVCTSLCGDGLVVGAEGCDDGGLADGDGCSASCALEPGWVCPTPGVPCAQTCSSGGRNTGEDCDDGNLVAGDGCSPNCVVEAQWSCAGGTATAPDACTFLDKCGDGVVQDTEDCDDGAYVDGDGCSASCSLEPGWSCPLGGTCKSVCGDGARVSSEGCDDGNWRSGDGCSFDCAVETGWSCVGGSPTSKDVCTTTAGGSGGGGGGGGDGDGDVVAASGLSGWVGIISGGALLSVVIVGLATSEVARASRSSTTSRALELRRRRARRRAGSALKVRVL